jgi:radical SAM protein with 4Fe4S-binding SPASM domain
MTHGAEGERPRAFALGVGLTNACNLSCAHCYRTPSADALRIEDVLAAVDALPVRAVNFGTGESALHPGFPALVAELAGRGIAVTVTTNGHSARALPDEVLALLRDVELSIDYPTEAEHDAARGAGNWALIAEQMSRCAALGVPATIVAVLMAQNRRALPDLARLAAARGAALRINVYQAVRGDAAALSYDEFWEAWGALLGEVELVVCGEPILRAVLGIPRAPGAGCGVETVRVTPRGAVIPCVYGGDAELRLEDLQRLGPAVVDAPSFQRLREVPAACAGCPHVETCGGGCASRRILRGGLDRPDEFCPFVRGRAVALPLVEAAPGRAMPKASSACTTIVRARAAPTGGGA